MAKSQERPEHGKRMLLHPSVSVGLDVVREGLELKKHGGAVLLWKLTDLVRHM